MIQGSFGVSIVTCRFVPLLSKYLFLDELLLLGIVDRRCLAVCQLPLVYLETSLRWFIDRTRLSFRIANRDFPPADGYDHVTFSDTPLASEPRSPPTKDVPSPAAAVVNPATVSPEAVPSPSLDQPSIGSASLAMPSVVEYGAGAPATIARPLALPLVGHAVRSLTFRDAAMDDDDFAFVLAMCPLLVTLDVQAAVVADEFAPTVGVSPAAIARLCGSHPRLRRLRLVYQDLLELPTEIHGMQHLERLTYGAHSILACLCPSHWSSFKCSCAASSCA